MLLFIFRNLAGRLSGENFCHMAELVSGQPPEAVLQARFHMGETGIKGEQYGLS